jgi:hypothetical protein
MATEAPERRLEERDIGRFIAEANSTLVTPP